MFKYTTVLVLFCANYANGLKFLTNIVENTAEATVTFRMFTRENTAGVKLDDNFSQLDPQKLTIFIVHGWLESSQRRWYGEITEALLKNYDCTVIQTNWVILARMEYSMSAQNTKIVGAKIGKTIQKLHEKYGIPLSNFWVLGHSLGSHIAGFAGQTVTELLGAKMAKIISFDAARPLFEVPQKEENKRLSWDDAEVVVNIHTDGGVLGYEAPIGIIDIYANGGTRSQPGCENLEELEKQIISSGDIGDLATCSHVKSHEYYIRALNGEAIVMTKCDTFVAYKNGDCENNAKIGLDSDFDKSDAGMYYFTTDN